MFSHQLASQVAFSVRLVLTICKPFIINVNPQLGKKWGRENEMGHAESKIWGGGGPSLSYFLFSHLFYFCMFSTFFLYTVYK